MNDELSFYEGVSKYTDPKLFQRILKSLPDDIESICGFTQNLLIHAYWLDKYDYKVKEKIKLEEMQLRYIHEILTLANFKTEKSITTHQEPNKRVVSTCRDFSLMVCTILRTKGIYSRLRCGFSTYLTKNHFEDHWICEYWSKDKLRWIMVDAQLDQLHRENLNITFNPLDVPSTQFIFAGKAWALCKAGLEKPENFGIHEFNGYSFIKSNIIKDLFALAKIELLPWDTGWGVLKDHMSPVADKDENEFINKLASFSSLSDVDQAKSVVNDSDSIGLPAQWDWSQSPTITELYDSL